MQCNLYQRVGYSSLSTAVLWCSQQDCCELGFLRICCNTACRERTSAFDLGPQLRRVPRGTGDCEKDANKRPQNHPVSTGPTQGACLPHCEERNEPVWHSKEGILWNHRMAHAAVVVVVNLKASSF